MTDRKCETCQKPLDTNRTKSARFCDQRCWWVFDLKRNREYKLNRPEKYMLKSAKRRADRNNIEFSITEKDIVIPEFCPLLDIKLEMHSTGRPGGYDNSPSLDRLDSTKGYTPDNVWVISYKANRGKNNLSYEEHKRLMNNWSKYL